MSDDVRRERLFDCEKCGLRGADTGFSCCEEVWFVPEKDYDRLRADKKSLCLQVAGLLEDVKRLRARVSDLERELNPDPEAHLMGWEGDDE